jgi:hypothetical protein
VGAGGRKDDAGGHREAEVDTCPCRDERERGVQVDDAALLHGGEYLQGGAFVALLQRPLEHFVQGDMSNANQCAGAQPYLVAVQTVTHL